ncbi:MAG: hydrogenase maturation protease [Chloroflexi bacterium]|jgi:hydrogenase maturation protease|nr:hydrogenase maturation protease [Chloroflexota bacterium]MBT3670345.1 hydrogenase maturation protease [Chloroflexota bacterium]MBT4002591.1 hydrogenase maturation protease [Chloroflexota bacterium]MBT4305532.1 hydrogenase maturation protease [Chloroflexota bacterium]MBT4533144.1 hydrogenase maturation protease [Chloroflexota bacterium]
MITKGKTIVIGLGNSILGDDGLGWRVVEEVENRIGRDPRLNIKEIDFAYYSLGGLALMENMEGYRKTIIVDSIVTGNNPIGTIFSLPLNELPNFSSGHSTAAHDTSLMTALEVGRKCGINLPEEIWTVVIEAENVYEFSEEISQSILNSIPEAVEHVFDRLLVKEWEISEPNEKID